MNNKPFLTGLLAAPFTPFDQNGTLNLDKIRPYAHYLRESRFSGAFICGTAGEAQSLSVEERKAVAEAWMNVADEQFKVVVHVGSPSVVQSVELASHAASIGASAISSIPPYFFKPSTVDDLFSFLRPVAAAAPTLPFYYYHFPMITGVRFPLRTILSEGKKQIPTLRGVKFTDLDLQEIQMAHYTNDGEFEVMCGFDEMLLAAQAIGIEGGIGSTFNYMPRLYFGVIDAWRAGDIATARCLQQQAVEAIAVINRYGGPTRAGKAMMKLLGIDCGSNRPPISPFSDKELSALKNEISAVSNLIF